MALKTVRVWLCIVPSAHLKSQSFDAKSFLPTTWPNESALEEDVPLLTITGACLKEEQTETDARFDKVPPVMMVLRL